MSRTYRSFAKINLDLEVVGRRSDGYHELRTLFQSVALHDRITLQRSAGGIDLRVLGADIPDGPGNLAYHAAEEFLQRWGDGGVNLVLDKRIPVGGGLGGGSSNAATVLLGLRQIFGSPKRIDAMLEVAAGLGADVPFFLTGGTAHGTGRGDQVTMMTDLEEQEVWLANPGLPVSTRDVFARLDVAALARERAAEPAESSGEGVRAASRPVDAAGRNDLEETVLGLFPAVKQVYNVLVQAGAQRVGVSGSGGSVFAFFDAPPAPRDLEQSLPDGSFLFRSKTLSRPSIARRWVVETEGDD